MTKSEAMPAIAAVNELFSKSPDGLREIVRAVMQEMLEAEMTDALGAEKGERTMARLGYRYRLREHADLLPEHIRTKANIQTAPISPTLKRRGRPPKSGDADHANG